LNRLRYIKIAQQSLAFIAVLFGLVTLFAGTRVLGGSDPGYIVFRPLLIYNTTMGFFYAAAGITAWRNIHKGKYAAATIFTLNFFVLAIIIFLYETGSVIAIDSLRAMTFRTVIWLVLLIGLAWVSRKPR